MRPQEGALQIKSVVPEGLASVLMGVVLYCLRASGAWSLQSWEKKLSHRPFLEVSVNLLIHKLAAERQ